MPAPRQPDSPRGTVYRGGTEPEAPADHPLGPSPYATGSLTGFILSRGQADAPTTSRRRLVIIALAILLMIAVLAGIALFAIGSLFDALLGG